MNKNFRKNLLIDNIIPKKLNKTSLKYRKKFLDDINQDIIKCETVKYCQCGSENLEPLSKIDRFGLPFGSLICTQCGLISTSPRIKQEYLPIYYENYYHSINYGKENLDNQQALYENGQGKKIFNNVKEFLPNKDTLSILEIGAGTGSVLKEFKEEAKQNNIKVDELGTEYSSECILKCKQNNINIIKGNSSTVKNLKKKFDLIILSHVFEHFIDLSLELKILHELMTEDSLLYIEVPGLLVNHKKGYYRFSYLIYHVHAHMYNFTATSLNNILEKNNFVNLSINEEVEGIYKISKNKQSISHINFYSKTIDYLSFLNENQEYFCKEYDDKQFYEKQYYQQKQTIKNRESTIKGKVSLIEKLQEKLKNHQSIINEKNNNISHLEDQLASKNLLINNYKKYMQKLLSLTHQIENSNFFQKYKLFSKLTKEIKKCQK